MPQKTTAVKPDPSTASSAVTPKKNKGGRPRGGNSLLRSLVAKFDRQLAADYPTIYEAIKKHALGGDASCAKLLMERAHPARKGRASPITIPAIKTLADARNAVAIITDGLGQGSVTMEEADQLTRMVMTAKSVIETSETEELQEQLAELQSIVARLGKPQSIAA